MKTISSPCVPWRALTNTRVVWTKIVKPGEVSVLDPTAGKETLTLVTCYPFYFVGGAPLRFIVRAQRRGTME